MKILVVVHGYPPRDNGGTELHARWLARCLAERGHQVRIFARAEDPDEAEFARTEGQDGSIPVTWVVNNFSERRASARHPLSYPRVAEIYRQIFEDFGPDLVHVQHLAGATPEVVDVGVEAGVPHVATVHDYWYMCERIQKLRRDLTICAGPEGGKACSFFCSLTSSTICLPLSGSISFIHPPR